MEYSLVIATMNRPEPLAAALASLMKQTRLPAKVCVVDASSGEETAALCRRWQEHLPLAYSRARSSSAARQRNEGALQVKTPLIGFMDDDVELPPDTLEKLLAPFSDPAVGGVGGRIEGLEHPVPHGLLRAYFRLQAGYDHPHYGARVIGPAINFVPAFSAESETLIPAQWLGSTLVLYRTELFEREKFPLFDGYSFLEDVHLSYRIGRSHRLYVRADASYLHLSQPSAAKADGRALARMRVRHQRLVARDLLGLTGFPLWWKLTLHRVFQTVAVLRSGEPQRWRTVQGFWWPEL